MLGVDVIQVSLSNHSSIQAFFIFVITFLKLQQLQKQKYQKGKRKEIWLVCFFLLKNKLIKTNEKIFKPQPNFAYIQGIFFFYLYQLATSLSSPDSFTVLLITCKKLEEKTLEHPFLIEL